MRRGIQNSKKLIPVSGVFVVLGFVLLLATSAAVLINAIEPEQGTPAGAARAIDDTSASGGKSILFSKSTQPTPTSGGSSGRPASYEESIARLRAANLRNKTADTSPYRDVPSAQLPIDNLLGGSITTYKTDRDDIDHSNQEFRTGQFRVMCEFSHFSYDDPIVYPGKPGRAHLHMFFGNTDVNAFTNYDTLINSGGGTCNGHELNRTGYWVPAIIDGQGFARIPKKILVYYKGFGETIGSAQPYPENMQMITKGEVNEGPGFGAAGSSSVSLSFRCINSWAGIFGYKMSYTLPQDCESWIPFSDGKYYDGNLEMNIKFQTCWNGQDPSNYQDNLRGPTNYYGGTCPGSHPIHMPYIEYRIFYPVDENMPQSGAGGAYARDSQPADTKTTQGWFLSSDVDPVSYNVGTPGDSYHGDWWGGWNKQINAEWLANCTNTNNSDCLTGLLNSAGSRGLKLRDQYNGPLKVPLQELYNEACWIPKTITKPADAAYCDLNQ